MHSLPNNIGALPQNTAYFSGKTFEPPRLA